MEYINKRTKMESTSETTEIININKITTPIQPESEKLKNIMNKLEKAGMENVKTLFQIKEGTIPVQQSLTNILQEGADEFEKEMGRPMTYGEMREMYG